MASSSSIVAIPSRTSNGYVSRPSAYEQVVVGGTRDTYYVSEAISVRYISRTGWAHKTCTSYSRKLAPGLRPGANLRVFVYMKSVTHHVRKHFNGNSIVHQIRVAYSPQLHVMVPLSCT